MNNPAKHKSIAETVGTSKVNSQLSNYSRSNYPNMHWYTNKAGLTHPNQTKIPKHGTMEYTIPIC